MKRYSIAIVLAAFSGGFGLAAQTMSAHIAESKVVYTGVKNNVLAMAEAMPETGYSFQPTPEIRTFGALMAHIADTNARLCGMAMGEQKSVDAAAKTAKADLVAALKESFAICDAAFDALNEGNALQPGGMNRSKLGLVSYNTTHANEEYGYGSVYLRLKGIVPPSSAGRGRGGR